MRGTGAEQPVVGAKLLREIGNLERVAAGHARFRQRWSTRRSRSWKRFILSRIRSCGPSKAARPINRRADLERALTASEEAWLELSAEAEPE